jgi:cold shock CspA family protein
MMHGTIQTIHAARGFGFLRDPEGAEVLFHRRALTPPERCATLDVGMRVAFEPESGPKGLRTEKLTVAPVKTPALRSFAELAAHVHRHAAGYIHDLTHLTRRSLMKVPPWCKPAFWGVVVGAVGIMIMGFAWGGWVLGSTAERLANDRADGAVTATLVPICVERFMGQADAAVKLAAFQQTVSGQQSQLIAQGGWATAIGSTDPNTAVARTGAHQLANRKT